VKSESEVVQSFPTLSDPMVCNLPGSSVHGIFQARVLEWGAIAFSECMDYQYLITHSFSVKLKQEIQGFKNSIYLFVSPLFCKTS